MSPSRNPEDRFRCSFSTGQGPQGGALGLEKPNTELFGNDKKDPRKICMICME